LNKRIDLNQPFGGTSQFAKETQTQGVTQRARPEPSLAALLGSDASRNTRRNFPSQQSDRDGADWEGDRSQRSSLARTETDRPPKWLHLRFAVTAAASSLA